MPAPHTRLLIAATMLIHDYSFAYASLMPLTPPLIFSLISLYAIYDIDAAAAG